ncbi:MAG: UvrD-helicase domain-containing protein [Thermoguttaceae bacterium]|nr:UvrD-helicase domain-containing protein [Thermoguttaceae bacterium]
MAWNSPDKLLEGLNAAQRDAVQHVEGPLLILAGPGSGKTRVVTHRIAHLLSRGVRGREILALTFTNKAAQEMQNRVHRLVPSERVWTSTFHKFCSRLLREYGEQVGLREGFTIYDTDDSTRLLKDILSRENLDAAGATPDSIANAISRAKSMLIQPEQYETRPGNVITEIVQRTYPTYQDRLLQANAVDFDDLLLHVVSLLRRQPQLRATLDARWRFVMVDEYQDTNLAQYAIARLLSVDYPNLAVTGDPDQSIYGWRGANLQNILDFEKDYPSVKVVRLEQNYRSTPQILHVAQSLIMHNTRRKQKDLYTENDNGHPVKIVTYADHWDEARQIADHIAREVSVGRRHFRDFAIFYRMNAFSRTFEITMRDHGIPVQLVGGVAFFQRAEIKDLLAYARVLLNPWDDVSLLRMINKPTRGIGQTTLRRVADTASRRGRTMLETLREIDTIGVAKRTETAVRHFVELYDRMHQRFEDSESLESLLNGILADSGYAKQYVMESEETIQRRSNIEELLAAAREFDSRYDAPVAASRSTAQSTVVQTQPNAAHTPNRSSNETDNTAMSETGTEDMAKTGGTAEARTAATPLLPSGVERLAQFLEDTTLATQQDDWEDETDRVTLMTLHASKGLEFPVVFISGVEQGILPHERSQHLEDQLEEERRLLFVGITRAREELELSVARYRDVRGMRRMTVPSSFLLELPREEMELEETESNWYDGFGDDSGGYRRRGEKHGGKYAIHGTQFGETDEYSQLPNPIQRQHWKHNELDTDWGETWDDHNGVPNSGNTSDNGDVPNLETSIETFEACEEPVFEEPVYEECRGVEVSGEDASSETISPRKRRKTPQKAKQTAASLDQDSAVCDLDDASITESEAFFPWEIEEVKAKQAATPSVAKVSDSTDAVSQPTDSTSQPKKKLSLKQQMIRQRKQERMTCDTARESVIRQLPAASDQCFDVGCQVLHPTRGIGEMIAISGEDGDPSVTVRFSKPPFEVAYRLNETPLRKIPHR